jgi:hypothetical protein
MKHKKDVKVRDMKPSKDTKGGLRRRQGIGGHKAQATHKAQRVIHRER